MKKILVTGANGFIGKALCEFLSQKGYYTRGTFRSKPKTGQCSLCNESVVIEDIGPDTCWKEALKDIDIVVHLAARVHVMKESLSKPLEEYRKINSYGTKKLAEEAVKAGVRKFIYLSTIKVNGEITVCEPFSEEDRPFPEDEYALSKMEAEEELKKIVQKSSLQVTVLRVPLVYGPGVKGNFFRLLKLVEKGIPVPFSKLKNKRSFVYLGNLVDAIVTCIKSTLHAFDIFLVNDDESFSTTELISVIAQKMNRKVWFIPIPLSLIEFTAKVLKKTKEVEKLVSSLVIDGSKIRSSLKWQPPFIAEKGIEKTVLWYNKSLKEEKGAKI